MPNRKKIIAGNWKMFKTKDEAIAFGNELKAKVSSVNSQDKEIIIFPSAIHIPELAKIFVNTPVSIGGQNCYEQEEGAFTGEVSVNALQSYGASYCLVGHSERREIFHENSKFLANKVNIILKNNLHPVFCCGETLESREKNQQNQIVESQIKESLFHLAENDFKKIIIAYEPVWAIGTGKTATPEDAEAMHKFIREIIAKKYSKELAENFSILYGGSMKPENAKELLSQPDIDGGLIGGASLKVDSFIKIIQT